jgi:hypothetical protein
MSAQAAGAGETRLGAAVRTQEGRGGLRSGSRRDLFYTADAAPFIAESGRKLTSL